VERHGSGPGRIFGFIDAAARFARAGELGPQKQSGHPRGMGWNPWIQLPDENRSAFVKIDKIGSDYFYRFRSV
jgi:hypothetical protein